jgi:spermidine/putrescine transport system substrate-binding protein
MTIDRTDLQRLGIARMNRNGLLRLRAGGTLSRRAFTLGALAVGAGLAARSLPTAKVGGAEVSYMGWQGYEEALKTDGFLDKNDIVLRTSYITGNEEIITKATSGGLGTMDLVTPDGAHTRFMSQLGILEPLDVSRIPNLAGLFPEFSSMDDTVIDGTRYSIPFMWGSIPLMYNADVVKEPPTSWLDLLKPEFKGKVALVEDMISMIGDFALAATKAEIPTWLTPDEMNATFDLLKRIKKEQARAIAPTYGELAALFATGEVVIAPAWQPVSVWAGNTVNLKWVEPKEGVWVFVDCYAMAKDAPNKEANYLLLNQAISPAGQAHAANVNMTACTVKDAVAMLNEQARAIYPYDNLSSAFARSGGRMYPLYPTEPDGKHATFDDILGAWEDFLKA